LIGLDRPVAHHDVALRESRNVRLVRHHHDRDPALVELLENVHDLETCAAVEVAGRLIGEDDFRIVDESTRDRDSLLLAAGKLARMMIFAAGKADGSEDFLAFSPSSAFVRRCSP
jgi:hypothetical protein